MASFVTRDRGLPLVLFVLGLAAALLPLPAWAASCGMGNKCPIVNALTVAANPAPAGKAVDVTCAGSDADGVVTKFTLTASAGSFANGLSTIDLIPASPQATATVTASWMVPAASGPVSLSCTAWDSGGFLGKPTAGDPVAITVQVAQGDPPTVALTAAAAIVFPGETITLSLVGSSPQGKMLVLALQASDGAVTKPDVKGNANWTAPLATGTYTLTATATDSDGMVGSATLQVRARKITTRSSCISSGAASRLQRRELATHITGDGPL